MMTWAIFALFAAAIAAWVLRPLWRRSGPDAGSAELAVYRDQLAEIDRDRSSGRLSDAEAEAARLEVQRRLLAAADRAAAASKPISRTARGLVVPVAAVLVAGSLGLYLQLGSPETPDQPFAGRPQAAPPGSDFAALVERLRERLAGQPQDLDGWLLLGRSLRDLQRFGESAEAFGHALALAPDRAEIAASFGEALVLAADGMVTPAAREAFRQALGTQPADPRSRYYLGLALAQAGDVRAAITVWQDILRQAPPGAPYAEAVRQQIAESARAAGIDTATLDVPARGPTAADTAAAAGMNAGDREQMIRGMVEGLAARLAAEPGDLDGWLRLGRSYQVLGEPEKAQDALSQAAKLAPGRVDVLSLYAQALYPPDSARGPPPPAFTAVMAQILALDPDNPEALWFVGIDALQQGDKPRAAGLLRKLLDRLPVDAPVRATVERQLKAAES
jgi:cytochrome c-type biogenesis protein CcmH